jgi:hypothetical protein
MGNLSESSKVLKEIIEINDHAKEDMMKEGKNICATCYQRQTEMLTTNKALLDELNALHLSTVQNEEKLEIINNIDPTELGNEILAPVSHEVRLQIMLSIFKGNNRFASFVESTGLSGGHLLYHINKLIQHRLIQQYSSKDYGLTRKGIKTMVLLAQITKE